MLEISLCGVGGGQNYYLVISTTSATVHVQISFSYLIIVYNARETIKVSVLNNHNCGWSWLVNKKKKNKTLDDWTL